MQNKILQTLLLAIVLVVPLIAKAMTTDDEGVDGQERGHSTKPSGITKLDLFRNNVEQPEFTEALATALKGLTLEPWDRETWKVFNARRYAGRVWVHGLRAEIYVKVPAKIQECDTEEDINLRFTGLGEGELRRSFTADIPYYVWAARCVIDKAEGESKWGIPEGTVKIRSY